MNLSAYDNLKTRALLYDISDERINEVLNLIGLSNTGKKKQELFFRYETTFGIRYGNNY